MCLEHAREKHNRSVDSVADLMGVPSKWTLYKWVQEASLPSRLIKSFENACGIDLVSRWLVTSSGKLVISIPIGRKGVAQDVNELQLVTVQAVQALMLFYQDQNEAFDTLVALQAALEGMAWHKGNVEKYQHPELPFEEA
jgi:hypothetical protein